MRLTITALVLLLSACASVERSTVDDALLPPPSTWLSPGAVAGELDADWWQHLGSPALAAAITQTLERNNDLWAAQARLTVAAVQAELAGADLGPSLDLAFGASRARSVFVGLPSGFAGPGSGPLSNTFNSFGVNLNASWEVDLWGRLRAGENAALAEVQATAEELRGLRQSLAAQTAKAWFAAVEANQQAELARTTLASYLSTESQVEDRFRGGVRSALDLRLARSQRMAAEAREQRWEELRVRAVRQLEVLQGRYPDGSSQIAGESLGAVSPVPVGLPAELVSRRPDLIAAERRIAAAGFRVESAEAALYPSLVLSGQGGTTSDEFRDLTDPDFLVWNLAANLVAPIFNSGRLRNQVALEAAFETESIASFAQAALRAYGEVEALLAAEVHLRQRETNLAAASDEANAARDLSEQRYFGGLEDYIAVLESQRNALILEEQVITVRRLMWDLRVDLHLALGGGFELTASDDSVERGELR